MHTEFWWVNILQSQRLRDEKHSCANFKRIVEKRALKLSRLVPNLWWALVVAMFKFRTAN
jgi:hypothetical protein